jgi:hypothetical protein
LYITFSLFIIFENTNVILGLKCTFVKGCWRFGVIAQRNGG